MALFLGCASAAQPHRPIFFRRRCRLVILLSCCLADLSCLGFRFGSHSEVIFRIPTGENQMAFEVVQISFKIPKGKNHTALEVIRISFRIPTGENQMALEVMRTSFRIPTGENHTAFEVI